MFNLDSSWLETIFRIDIDHVWNL